MRRNYTHRSLPCLCRLCVLAYADTLQVSACHCEERSDVAIRYSLRCNMTESSTLGECVSGYEFAQTAANLLSFSAGKTDCHASSPQSPPCPAPAKDQSRATLPWGSSPHKGCPFAGSPSLARNDMQKERRVRGCKYVPPLSLRGAKRRGNPHLLRQHKRNATIPGEYGEAADLP